MQQWKINRQVYAALMSGQHTDILEDDAHVIEEGVFFSSAAKYIKSKDFPLMQPSKSRVVAIVYAALIEKFFPETSFTEALNDPELLTEDAFFKPYSEDQAGYDMLLEGLPPIKEWQGMGGWIDRTIKYFWLECMDDGVEFTSIASADQMQDFLDSGDTPITL